MIIILTCLIVLYDMKMVGVKASEAHVYHDNCVGIVLVWVFLLSFHHYHSTLSGSVPPTPTATMATQNLGASYTGTLEDLSTNVSSHMTLTHVRQNKGLISGSFTSTLMRGNYSGYLDSSKHIFFTVPNPASGAPLYFTGTVQPAGNMEGSFCTIDQNNQCISGDVFGVWNVVLVR